MARVAIVTTSYPSYDGDPAGHFVELEAHARAASGDSVVVLAPGVHRSRSRVRSVVIERLPGGSCFGWPGALARLRANPIRALAACTFVVSARRKLRDLGAFDDIVAHWMVPCGYPIANAGEGSPEVVVHGGAGRPPVR